MNQEGNKALSRRQNGRKKAYETLKRKLENGYTQIQDTNVKRIDEAWESRFMRDVKYD